MMESNLVGPPSLSTLLSFREKGRCTSRSFERRVYQALEQKHLLDDPEIVSPHKAGIASLSSCRNGRFLLAGGADGTISVYDLSRWGSEQFLRRHNGKQQQQQNMIGASSTRIAKRSHYDMNRQTHLPIARSLRVPSPEDPQEIPAGHSCGLVHVQWYPIDTGAFLSASMDGTLLFWDTNQMQPVLRVNPFETSSSPSVHLQATGVSVAFGARNHAAVKLVDLRSGSCSHQLIGHGGGITVVQWSPTSSVVLASGSRDGTIRLWDIRKAGSRACITVLDRNNTVENLQGASMAHYSSDYAHLRVAGGVKRPRGGNRNTDSNLMMSSNNYQAILSRGVRSHNGPISALKIFPDGHTLASVCGSTGELLLWDLRDDGHVLHQKFVAPGVLQAVVPTRRTTPLCINKDTIWVGYKTQLLGFSAVHGGSPQQVLKGHLSHITTIEQMEPSTHLLTASDDGMILTWGHKARTSASMNTCSKRIIRQDKDNW